MKIEAKEIKGKVDFGIITIREDEFAAILNHFPPYTHASGEREYAINNLKLSESENYTVAVVRCPEQGNLEAENVAHDMIEDISPQWILLVGIGGGLPNNDFTLGDVVTAMRLQDFCIGAVIEGKSAEYDIRGGSIAKDVQVSLAHLPAMKKELEGWNTEKSIGMEKPQVLFDKKKSYGNNTWSDKVEETIKHHFPLNKEPRLPLVTASAIASTDLLIKDTEIIKNWQKFARHIGVVEMELAGVYKAAQTRNKVYPILAIRGISDIVGFNRESIWTTYACHTAAAFAYAFLKTRPIEPIMKTSISNFIDDKSDVIKNFTENITPPVPNFVGRADDLITITNWYNSEAIKIGAIIGLGGEGKSSIARKWFDNLLSTKTEPHIFWWGFYRNNSIDRFLNSLVSFIAGNDIDLKDSWGKVDWIKKHIGTERYLIILDGLEEMQKAEEGEPFGKMVDAAFKELLMWLAEHINGLVLITTRFPMKDIEGYIRTKYENIELEGLSVEDARQLFIKVGVKGEQKDIDNVIKEYMGHALSLTLLSNALVEYFKGDIKKAGEVPPIALKDDVGGKAHRILQWYDSKLRPEQRQFMVIFSLFRRDVTERDFSEVLRYKAGGTFNDALISMNDLNFNKMVLNLVKLRLINKESDNTYTAHPHIKAFFESVFPAEDKKACHRQIKEYAKTYEINPANTLEDMSPLIEQVYHGCQAGLYDAVWGDVYRDKIVRKDEFFITYKLGAWETNLQLIKNFFPNGDLGQDPLVSSERDKSWLINAAGVSLVNTGRPQEAVALYLKGIEIDKNARDWKNASVGYQNLTNLEIRIGNIEDSSKSARNALKMAEDAENQQYMSNSKAHLGYILFLRGDIVEPITLFNQATEIEKTISGYELYSYSGIMYAYFLIAIDKTSEAFALTTKNLEICNSNNWQADISRCLCVLGGLKRRDSKYDQAQEDLSKALNIGRETGMPDILIEALIEQGRLFLDLEQYDEAKGAADEAKGAADEALSIIQRTGFWFYEPDSLIILARYYKATGEIEKSRQTAQEAWDKADKMGYHWPKVEAGELI
jgi:nucleoside phosphorylase/tetratricopeptide (TPR) repeat protein